jgi:hypothetical protein
MADDKVTPDEADGVKPDEAGGGDKGKEGGKTYTEAELQAETDRRVSQALKTREAEEKARIEEIEKKRIENEGSLEEKLALLERKSADQERTAKSEKLRADTLAMLESKGQGHLSALFVNVADTPEARGEQADQIQAIIDKSVEKQVKEQLAVDPPPNRRGGEHNQKQSRFVYPSMEGGA